MIQAYTKKTPVAGNLPPCEDFSRHPNPSKWINRWVGCLFIEGLPMAANVCKEKSKHCSKFYNSWMFVYCYKYGVQNVCPKMVKLQKPCLSRLGALWREASSHWIFSTWKSPPSRPSRRSHRGPKEAKWWSDFSILLEICTLQHSTEVAFWSFSTKKKNTVGPVWGKFCWLNLTSNNRQTKLFWSKSKRGIRFASFKLCTVVGVGTLIVKPWSQWVNTNNWLRCGWSICKISLRCRFCKSTRRESVGKGGQIIWNTFFDRSAEPTKIMNSYRLRICLVSYC